MIARWSAMSDRALWLAIGAALFALSAWPLALVELPPLQDLPNHVASSYIAQHPDRYPEYVFNGFWKSNSVLEIWLRLFDDLRLGARLFVALALAVTAFVLPWFVLQLAGRRAMVTASLFVWPLVHGYCLAMGMLNFAIAVPGSLVLLALLDRQRAAPSLPRALVVIALSVAIWLAHPFPLLVVGGLCALEVLARPTWRDRVRTGAALVLPLAPIGLLVAGTAVRHLIKSDGAPAVPTIAYLTPWELVAHFWLDAHGALTRWGSATVIPALLLPIFAWRGRAGRSLLGRRALIALVIAYVALPLMVSNWWYLNTRVMPFVWVALALAVPHALPRPAVALLVAAALAYSASLGVDYVRLDRDRAEIAAGTGAVPERATLLPLLFRHRKTSDFTASLTHAWADYVLERQTSAPLVFAVERSYAITYRTFPPAALIPPALDRFAELHATPELTCASSPVAGLGRDASECAELWRLLWAQFWRVAEPRFTHVLTWAMPAEAREILPPRYRLIFEAGDLAIYEHGEISAER